MKFWHWLMDNVSRFYVYGSLAICLLILIAVITGFSCSPRWGNFR